MEYHLFHNWIYWLLPHAYIVRREGNVITGISLSVQGGVGTPVHGSFPGLWSQVLSWGVPQFQMGLPSPSQGYTQLRLPPPPS